SASITGSANGIYKPTSTNSRFGSTGASTRSTPSVRCSASLATQRRRPMPSFIPATGITLHLEGECVNRIGVVHTRRLLMAERIFNVLFLCTGNSARSIIAESILRKVGAGRFRAFSAGSHPKGAVNPFALKVLEDDEYPIDGLRSKSWDEFAVPGAPVMDFVFTVCDTAAAETCPVWPGQPMTAHWGIEDPAAVEGTNIQKEAAFVLTARYLRNRITIFSSLPMRSLDKMALNAKLREIGELEG